MQASVNTTGMLDLGGSEAVATARTKSVPSHPETPSSGRLLAPQTPRIRAEEQTVKASISGIKIAGERLG